MNLIKRFFGAVQPQQFHHPVFGKLLLMNTKKGSYWEAETNVNGETISVSIEAMNDALPSEEQTHFYNELVGDIDKVFAKAAPLLVPEYEKWTSSAFPDNWRDAFKFVGVSVPLAGLGTNPWQLSYDCLTDKAGHMFTCYFENGNPTYVSIDG
jgi:hypothetical protein